ncbi:hypothetical protein [Streptomyces sp. NPDC048637]|uniref:hypothetical protein n=1 Tax=Streptomyces sp. NPDC048637 TaxID=3155636 RepID=UPI00342D9D5E
MCRNHEKPEPDRATDLEEDTSPPLWQEARRRVVLGAAGVAAPALLALLEWWSRR